MLGYEVHKKEAALPKTNNGTVYQFQQIDEHESRLLIVIGHLGEAVAEELSGLNYKYHQITSVQEANALVKRMPAHPAELPTAIISDYTLSDGTAFDLFQNMKSSHMTAIIPFIIISDDPDPELKNKARKLGVDDFYNTPINSEDIHTRISFLKQYKKEKKKFSFSAEPVFENHTSLLKRFVDIVVASAALIFLSPLLLLVALIIKLESRGPVVYVSKRVGTGYDIFDLYKFRSMRNGADVELKKLAHLNQYKDDESKGAFFKLENDPRVTLFGRFLRASSIDEIPQLLNVIKGDMSIVGNRPLPLYEAEQLTRDVWAKRFLAPAGLTGLWQVSRRGGEEMSVAERVILDNTYADNHSFLLDLKIMLKTFPALLSKIHS